MKEQDQSKGESIKLFQWRPVLCSNQEPKSHSEQGTRLMQCGFVTDNSSRAFTSSVFFFKGEFKKRLSCVKN